MAKPCPVCGGLIPAPGEMLGYSGPLCSGYHAGQYPHQAIPVFPPNPNIEEKLDKIIELLTPKGGQQKDG